MTTDPSGKGSPGVLSALRKLREQWVLIVALASALFWARDLMEEYARLPREVSRQGEAVKALSARVAGIETRLGVPEGGPAPRPGIAPDALPGPLEGRAGAWTVLRWRSVYALDPDCVPRSASAVLVDGEGHWHALESRLRRDGQTPGERSLALGVRPHESMGTGRARIRIRLTHACSGLQREESSDWVPFVLLGP
jgi:hypothetical protein